MLEAETHRTNRIRIQEPAASRFTARPLEAVALASNTNTYYVDSAVDLLLRAAVQCYTLPCLTVKGTATVEWTGAAIDWKVSWICIASVRSGIGTVGLSGSK